MKEYTVQEALKELDKIDDSDSLLEMATIGQFMQKAGDSQNKTGFKVFVTNDSRPLFHIHIVEKDGKQKRVCVEFSNPPKYFKYGGYPDLFTTDESEEFNTFLQSPYKYPQTFKMGKIKFNVRTYWEYCIYQWKLENDGVEDNIPLDVDERGFVIYPPQPDYTQLK